jgi:NADH dehydrogenase
VGVDESAPHRVVVVGGGFGGLSATRALRGAPVELLLIDRSNHHLFQPFLYQVATGILSEGEVATPLRGVLHRQRNARVRLAEVNGFDLDARTVSAIGYDGVEHAHPYDTLVVAAGAGSSYFGHDEWEQFAPGLKNLRDALHIRTRILGAFERAADSAEAAERTASLTFVVVGAGPTGVEVTGQISELARRTLPRDFSAIDTTSSRIVLVDAGSAVLAPFPDKLRRRAASDLERMGVEIHLETMATDVDADGVELTAKDGSKERVPCRTVVWAAGVHASPLAKMLGEAAGAEVDRAGRVAVQPDCTLPGHPEVFAVGDMVSLDHLPGVAQPAIQEGHYVAKMIRSRLRGGDAPPPFKYRDKGSMAVIGRSRAVVDAYGVKLAGRPALLGWAFVHIAYLVGWGNRLVTLTRWFFAFVLRARGQRAITVTEASRDGGTD